MSESQATLYTLQMGTVVIPIRGITSLICHRFSEEAQAQIEDKQQKRAARAKEARDPEGEFRRGLYIISEQPPVYGFPAVAFKQAFVAACRFVDGMPMTQARGAFHVLGDLLPIQSESGPTMRTDRVVIGQGTTTVAYRPEFVDWRVQLMVRFNAGFISAEQIVNLAETAGFSVGVGDWRPEKDGNHGMFEVDRDAL